VADPRQAAAGKRTVIRRVAARCLVANVFLSGLKLAAGIVGRSQALVADSVHSLSDLTTDIAVFVGVGFWTRPPDAGHPRGHGKIETVIGAVIGMVVALAGIGLGVRSIHSLEHMPFESPGTSALVVALLSVVLKEWLYRWTSRKGRETGSSALAANAWHQRSDALSSVPVVVAVAASIINPAWAVLDVLCGMVVSVFIVAAAWKILSPALSRLVDSAPPPEVVEGIRRIALAEEGVIGVHSIRSVYHGDGIEVDLHVAVDGTMPVTMGFMICRRVEDAIRRNSPGVMDVTVRVEPSAPCGDPDSCALIADGLENGHGVEGGRDEGRATTAEE
jgi:cation diffusion facilitator family transporter